MSRVYDHYQYFNSSSAGTVFRRQNLTSISNFHPLEVVGRGSETQLQVCENYFKDAPRAERVNIIIHTIRPISIRNIFTVYRRRNLTSMYV